MSFTYGEYDGEPFPTPDSLFARPEVVQFLLMYGQEGLDALSETEEQQHQELIDEMIAAGLLEKEEGTGKLKMTPKMVRGMEHRSLLEIFANLQRGNREGHETQAQGRSEERQDGSKPYVFGDKLSDLDMASTLRNALSRSRSDGTDDAVPPLKLSADDLEVYPTEGRTDTALCILLDLSGSMMRYRRFLHAKQVALGMAGLIRRMFPQDTVDYVGFYSLADALREEDLPLVMPKPVSIFDHQVRMRMPLEQAQQDPANIPQHFTNLQLGLRQARSILKRRGAMNRQIFVITDGQPTAHVEPNASGAGEMSGPAPSRSRRPCAASRRASA